MLAQTSITLLFILLNLNTSLHSSVPRGEIIIWGVQLSGVTGHSAAARTEAYIDLSVRTSKNVASQLDFPTSRVDNKVYKSLLVPIESVRECHEAWLSVYTIFNTLPRLEASQK